MIVDDVWNCSLSQLQLYTLNTKLILKSRIIHKYILWPSSQMNLRPSLDGIIPATAALVLIPVTHSHQYIVVIIASLHWHSVFMGWTTPIFKPGLHSELHCNKSVHRQTSGKFSKVLLLPATMGVSRNKFFPWWYTQTQVKTLPANGVAAGNNEGVTIWGSNVCVLCCCQSLKMLDDEETTDNELRTKFNQRWNRTPSGDLYKPLRAGMYTHW